LLLGEGSRFQFRFQVKSERVVAGWKRLPLEGMKTGLLSRALGESESAKWVHALLCPKSGVSDRLDLRVRTQEHVQEHVPTFLSAIRELRQAIFGTYAGSFSKDDH